MITRFERFSYAISEISRHWHSIAAQEMGKHGLKAPHSVYLLALARWEAGMTAAQLAQDCGKDKADVSRMVTILEEKGLVCREGASYRANLRLTEAGMEAARQVQTRAAKAVELGGEGITRENRETFYAVLELIAKNLRTISEDGLPK